MRLLFIRHGDPDYEHDSLTEKGRKEAQALAAVISSLHPGTIYLSPLGRAQETASYSLKALGRSGETYEWLQEFQGRVDVKDDPELYAGFPHAKREDGEIRPIYAWDIMPAYCADHPEIMNPALWRTSDLALKSDVLPFYDHVKQSFNALLKSWGYVNEGHGRFRVEQETTETLTFFCHFGITSVLLSVLWDCSPFFLMQQLCMLPTSVTEVVTEERAEGIAMFRALRIGDQSHLYLANEEPSFAARYREVYSDVSHRK